MVQVAYTYNRQRNVVELALLQEGSDQAAMAAAKAVEAGGMHGFGGSVTVRVHEVEGHHDHVVSLSGEACQVRYTSPTFFTRYLYI
jgi:hypothetical protein